MIDNAVINSTPENKPGLNIFFNRMHMMVALIVIAWMNSGLFTYTYALPFLPNYIRYGLYLAWSGLALLGNKRFFKTFIIQLWPLLLFYFYILLISFFTEISLEVEIKSINYLIIVYSIFIYYFDSRYIRFQRILSVFFIMDLIIVGINTYIHLKANPMIARYLSTGTETRERLLGETHFPGVGSYGYSYALVAIILLLTFLFLNQHKSRLPLLLAIIAGIFLLMQTTFTIAILFTMIFITLLIIIRYGNKYTTIIIVLLGIALILIFQGAVASTISLLANIENMPYEVSVRFEEIANFFSGKDIYRTDLNARMNLYMRSIDAFAHNLLTGTALNHNSIYRSGGHSAWLDLLATFGLFAVPFFVFLYKAYMFCKNKVPKKFIVFTNIYWLYFICLGFVNTLLFAPIYTVWFLFLPMFINAYFGTENYILAEQ